MSRAAPYSFPTMPDQPNKKIRPVYLDLPRLALALPVPAIVSILHRISGGLLFVFAALVLSLLQMSLTSRDGFEAVHALMAQGPVKLIVLILFWSFVHHLCAGLRFLALDLHWGIELAKARWTSKIVLAVSLVATVLFAGWLI